MMAAFNTIHLKTHPLADRVFRLYRANIGKTPCLTIWSGFRPEMLSLYAAGTWHFYRCSWYFDDPIIEDQQAIRLLMTAFEIEEASPVLDYAIEKEWFYAPG